MRLAVAFRLRMGSMGQQASLTVLTNAGGKTLRRILGAADTQALGRFLQDPQAAAAALADVNRQQIRAVVNGSSGCDGPFKRVDRNRVSP